MAHHHTAFDTLRPRADGFAHVGEFSITGEWILAQERAGFDDGRAARPVPAPARAPSGGAAAR